MSWIEGMEESRPGQTGCINLRLLPYICIEPSPCKNTKMLREVCSITTSQVLSTCSAATWVAAAAATGAAPTADFRAAQAMLIDIWYWITLKFWPLIPILQDCDRVVNQFSKKNSCHGKSLYYTIKISFSGSITKAFDHISRHWIWTEPNITCYCFFK